MRLSNSQREVVVAPIGAAIQVLASAGSGKTRVLTERVRYILTNTKKDGIIGLTFTNKAADEMRTRLRDEQDIETRCWIATIHSVAQRILEQYGHTIGLPSDLHIYERDQDRQMVFLESLRRADISVDDLLSIPFGSTASQRDAHIQKYMARFSRYKRELLAAPTDVCPVDGEDEEWCVFQAYQEALLASGGIDFDDILVYAHKILLEQPWCGDVYRTRYRHICVDEAQDLNKAQYEFIRALCGDDISSVMMVGDPRQMIYGFNGSSTDYLTRHFVEDFRPLVFGLTENYRSSQAVVRLANSLIDSAELQAVYPLAGRAEVKRLDDEASEAHWVCDKIEELLGLGEHEEIEGRITLDKMVVIARNRFVFPPLRKELEQRGLVYSLSRGEQQVEPASTLGRALDLGIRLRLNPKDWIHGQKLCALLEVPEPEYWEDAGVLRLLTDQANASSRELLPALEALRLLDELDVDEPKMVGLFDKVEATTLELVASTPDAVEEMERALQELSDLRDCWRLFRQRGLGRSLAAFRNSLALGQIGPSHKGEGLTLSTVHTMKGLERDIVFLIAMCEGVFPDYRATSPRQIAEERNSAFVAVTRARRWIFVTYPAHRRMPWGDIRPQSPSRFVREMSVG